MHPIFAIGLPHGMDWVWVFLVLVLIFGADKIPKLARGLGKSLGEFKKAKEDFEKELHTASSTDSVATPPPAQPALDAKMNPPAGTQPTSAGSVDELTKKI
jgi:TatA/E family protein of Tat protein translocase